MLELEAQMLGVERDGASDILHLVTDAVNALDERVWCDSTWDAGAPDMVMPLSSRKPGISTFITTGILSAPASAKPSGCGVTENPDPE
jgi:hypothetical protein